MNFYWSFMKRTAALSHLLSKLTQKDAKWSWEKKQMKAFKEIRKEFCRDEWLRIFNSDKKLVMKIDVSEWMMAGILV